MTSGDIHKFRLSPIERGGSIYADPYRQPGFNFLAVARVKGLGGAAHLRKRFVLAVRSRYPFPEFDAAALCRLGSLRDAARKHLTGISRNRQGGGYFLVWNMWRLAIAL